MSNLLQTKYGYKLALSENVRRATLDRVKLMEGKDKVITWLDQLISQSMLTEERDAMTADLEWFKKRLQKQTA